MRAARPGFHEGITLSQLLEQRLSRLLMEDGSGENGSGEDYSALMNAGLIGLEKENLRVSPEGTIAQTVHPEVLGSALTHPYITTDFSEALLEFITPPLGSVGEALGFLQDIQQYVYQQLDDEILWAASMPCVLAGGASIPIAQYGNSNTGLMKMVYRRGLGHRYGKTMQVIAGVHVNYSFADEFWRVYQTLENDTREAQEFISESYFALIRNLQRVGWLIPYLFGASPAVCKSFVNGKSTDLEEYDHGSLYYPFGTSLRMSDIGYQNTREKKIGFKASYDSVASYINSLEKAVSTPCERYEKIGVIIDGEHHQLNANILQIENEYYSSVRPKQTPALDEKPVTALRERGVQYVELRSLDVNAFEPMGINENQLRFLEVLMIYSLMADDETLSDSEIVEIDANQRDVAQHGRDPELKLQRKGKRVGLKEWANDVLDAMDGICQALDKSLSDTPYSGSLALQKNKVENPDLTPSARMLQEMREKDDAFFHFAKRMSLQHYEYFKGLEESQEQSRYFDQAVRESWQKHRERDTMDSRSFEEFLRDYYAQV